ncbi:hypothetical protein LEMLEM_LOCUS23569 [Lemmus lemmus]
MGILSWAVKTLIRLCYGTLSRSSRGRQELI